MVLHLSDSRPSFCEFHDLPAPRSDSVQDKIGKFNEGYIPLKKKHQHPRTEEDGGGGSDQDKDEFPRKKKSKKNNSEKEASFVALVTASNLHKDALDLPKDFTSSNGLSRRCRNIVINDGGERSWTLDLRFNKSSGTFYISQGWRSFCDENGKKAGGLFVFKLVANGETPLISFGPAESRAEQASKKDSLPVELSSGKRMTKEKRKKKHLRYRNSTSPGLNRFVMLTLTDDSFRKSRLYLPLPFTRENGMSEAQSITLLGKDDTKWLASLRQECNGTMNLEKGWRDFAQANGLKIGESFTLELIWKEETPMLSLISTESSNGTKQQGEYCSKAKKKTSIEPNSGNKTKKPKNNRDTSSTIQHRFVTLTLTPDDVRDCKLILPSQFMKANGINKLGKITLLGKDGMKWFAYLLSKDGLMAMGCGWKSFCEANGVKIGESFTLECSCEQEDTTHVFKFCSTSSKSM